MLKTRTLLCLLALASEALLASCAHQEGSLGRLRAQAARKPNDVALQQRYYLRREKAVEGGLLEAQDALSQDRLDAARHALIGVLRADPRNAMALDLLSRLESAQAGKSEFAQAARDLARGDFEGARQALRPLIAANPADPQALALERKVARAEQAHELAVSLDPRFAKEKVSLDFQGAPLRSVFYALSQGSGLNFSFAPGVPLDAPTTLFAKDTPVLNALDMVLASQNLKQRVLNANTVAIAARHPAPVPLPSGGVEAKAFYLTNAHPKEVQALLEAMTTIRRIYVDDTLNMVVVKGTPPEIRKATRLIAMIDRPPPEVMLDVEVLEVKRDLLLDLGMEYPNQFSLLNVPPTATSVTTPTGTTITTPSAVPLTLESLRSINASEVTINQLMMNLQDNTGDVRLLANPRIRVKNRVQAQIKVGERVPVFTSDTTPTGVVSSSVSYLDVGLDLKVKPTVMLDRDVQIQIALEVSDILNQVTGANGAVGYQIGTRDAQTTLRLADGQTQILAGLIQDNRSRSMSGIPGLDRVPVLGWLFGDHRIDNTKTEIVLLITPHIVRNLDVDAQGGAGLAEASGLDAGTPAAPPPAAAPAPAAPSRVPPGLPPGFVPPGTRLPPGFMAKPGR
ncbi:MAG: type II secretion system protein D [Betaproteobacteria bacterium]|nr:type II secretion system protein D [Betaproteobacteria bacterium]